MADDTVYPSGYNIVSRYETDKTVVDIGSPFIINRIIVNNESFPLNGLFFAEGLPPNPDCVLGTHTVTVGEQEITYLYENKPDSAFVEGFQPHYWIIDSPFEFENQKYTLNPGDSIILTISLTPNYSGTLILPHQTVSFYGDANGFFVIGDTITIDVQQICGNADGFGTVNLKDITYLIKYKYKDGPEPLADSDVNNDGSINIKDITYLIRYKYKDGLAPVCE
jgi:hypothetical protein